MRTLPRSQLPRSCGATQERSHHVRTVSAPRPLARPPTNARTSSTSCTRLWHPPLLLLPSLRPTVVAPAGRSTSAPPIRPASSPRPADTPPPPINAPHSTAATDTTNTAPLPLPAPPPTSQPEEEKPRIAVATHPVTIKEEPLHANEVGGAAKDGQEPVLARAILDVFEECLKELRPSGDSGPSADESDLLRRWKVQRLAEMDAMARRMRLVLEDSAGR
ncbi:classical arabinogalactan protein 9-like [Ananas comosus]|uniref:Classical arabinogalactan protein 9-like n=1 Tax=Ananas comosus TaxID=4615 RepID=A0A6P5G8C8_ANACO|nr:classical arabinogalactan protein 9-like [Ananas comosus]